MKRTFFIILIGISLALLFRRYCFEVVYVATPSMAPSYNTGIRLLISKANYLFQPPERGDVVLLTSPLDGRDLIKRIVGLPGERIGIKNKEVYINGSRLDEPYTQHTRSETLLVGDNIEPFEIPPGHFFVMGDNRDVSRDSRDWIEGKTMHTETVSIDNIKGEIIKSF